MEYYENGYVEFVADLKDVYDEESGEGIYVPSNYPFSTPKVYLDGAQNVCLPEVPSSWYDDSVIVVNDDILTKYTNFIHFEVLIEDEEGNDVWMDGRTVSFEECLKKGRFKGARTVEEYEIERLYFDSLEKKKYKTTLVSASQLDVDDCLKYIEYIDPELVKRVGAAKDNTATQ